MTLAMIDLLWGAGLLAKRKEHMNICFQHEQLLASFHKLKI